MSRLDELRDAGCTHPEHEFTEEEVARFESLTDEEVGALISAKAKLGHELCTKQHDDAGGDVHPATVPI